MTHHVRTWTTCDGETHERDDEREVIYINHCTATIERDPADSGTELLKDHAWSTFDDKHYCPAHSTTMRGIEVTAWGS